MGTVLRLACAAAGTTVIVAVGIAYVLWKAAERLDDQGWAFS